MHYALSNFVEVNCRVNVFAIYLFVAFSIWDCFDQIWTNLVEA